MAIIENVRITTALMGTHKGATEINTPATELDFHPSSAYSFGTGNNQINKIWQQERTVTAAAENLDLAGVLVDDFGNTLTFTLINFLIIENRSTTATEVLTITGSFCDAIFAAGGTYVDKIGPSGHWMKDNPIDGYVVTAGSADIITVDPGADTIIYRVAIGGLA